MWGISTLKQWRTTPPNHWQCRKLLLSQKWLEIKHRRRLAHIAQISLHSHEHLLDFRSESPCVPQQQEMSEMNSWFQGLLDEMSLAELKERLRIDPTSASSCCCCCSCCYLQYCYQNSKIREGDTFHAQCSVWDHGAIDSWMWRRKFSHQLESNCSWNNGGPKKSPGSSPARLSHSVRKNWTWSVKGSQWQLLCRLWSSLLIVSNWKMVTLVFPTGPNWSIAYALSTKISLFLPQATGKEGGKTRRAHGKGRSNGQTKGFNKTKWTRGNNMEQPSILHAYRQNRHIVT